MTPDRREACASTCAIVAIGSAPALVVGSSDTVTRAIAASDVSFWGLLIAQLLIVLILSARARRLTASATRTLSVLYISVTAVMLPCALRAFTPKSIVATFLMTGGVFAGLVIHGARTKQRLAAFGQVLFVGLVGLLLVSAVVLSWPEDPL
jgi:uncharacterized protein